MRKTISFLTFSLIMFVQMAFAYQVVEFSAYPSNNMIEVSWQIQDGAGIIKFVLQRSIDETQWTDITEVSYIDDETGYTYQDYQVTKKGTPLTTNYYYRLKVYLQTGDVEFTSSIMARPKYSGIYRTWGSLKALFR